MDVQEQLLSDSSESQGSTIYVELTLVSDDLTSQVPGMNNRHSSCFPSFNDGIKTVNVGLGRYDMLQ
jgi:hypothetical protein